MKPLNLFIIVQPGLESYAIQELNFLGIKHLKATKGAILCTGHLTTIIRINVFCRCVSRVLVDLGSFYADNFRSLQKEVLSLPWDHFIDKGQPLPGFCFHTASYDSALYHEKAIEERMLSSLSSYFKQEILAKPTIDELTQLIVIHVKKNHFTIRLDTTGVHLHKRGYNKFTDVAPLRETIAAAMLYASKATSNKLSILDPMCGSGTIPIEAGLLKNKVLWDSFRRFRFESWPDYSEDVMAKAKQTISFPDYPYQDIIASDVSENACKIALANVRKAGLDELIRVQSSALSDYQTSILSGVAAVFNPPWGKRLSATDELYQEIFRLGQQTAESIIISPHLYAKQGNVLFSVKSGDIKLHCQRL